MSDDVDRLIAQSRREGWDAAIEAAAGVCKQMGIVPVIAIEAIRSLPYLGDKK